MAYRRAFVERWKTYDMRFHKWDNDGCELPRPDGFPLPDNGPFRLVLITHDGSPLFYQNDRRKIVWSESTSRPMPQPKGDGQSIMVSDFLTSEWGPCVMAMSVSSLSFSNFFTGFCFQGKLGLSSKLARTAMAISARKISSRRSTPPSIFLRACPRGNFRALFLFDNAPSHQKRALDAISARENVERWAPFPFFLYSLTSIATAPKRGWAHGWAAHAMRSAPKW